MVEGTGLENRHTRKGIEGSNPSPSVSRRWLPRGAAPRYVCAVTSLFQVAGSQPLDCIATGLCGAGVVEANPVPSGLMFVAIGLVALGLSALARIKVNRRQASGDG